MQEERSFQHFRVQYGFGFRNENILRVKVDYFSHVNTNWRKMHILKMGVPMPQVLLNILSIYLLPRVWLFRDTKRVVMSF